MTEEEVLNRYRDTIDNNIKEYCEKNNFTNIQIQAFADKYRVNFVKGFFQGVKEVDIQVAKKMLLEKANIKFISKVTDLTESELLKLKTSL